MRYGISFLTVAFTMVPSLAFAADPVEIPSPVEEVFVPPGFDDNDNVEVILQGQFRNTCYRTGRNGFTVDEENKQIRVWATSYKYEGGPCALLVTPFIQVVKVGIVPNGEYQVVYEHNEEVTRTFAVGRRTTESPDEFTYAPVTEAAIRIDDESGRQRLVLEGIYPLMLHGCSMITEVKVARDESDIVVVQPIMEIFDGEACEDHKLEFTKVVPLTMPFIGKGILHVRVLNGNSLNKYLEIYEAY